MKSKTENSFAKYIELHYISLKCNYFTLPPKTDRLSYALCASVQR